MSAEDLCGLCKMRPAETTTAEGHRVCLRDFWFLLLHYPIKDTDDASIVTPAELQRRAQPVLVPQAHMHWLWQVHDPHHGSYEDAWSLAGRVFIDGCRNLTTCMFVAAALGRAGDEGEVRGFAKAMMQRSRPERDDGQDDRHQVFFDDDGYAYEWGTP